MIWQTLIFQPDSTILLLHVGIDDKSSGGKIALLIIILALILLSVANLAWKKYSSNKK
jgi:hypothetical protein